MFSINKNIESIQKLLLEFKNYYILQKKFIRLDVTEKLTVILSAVAISLILLVLIAMICFFATFALAFYLGNLLNSLSLGFIIVAGILLLAVLLFYANRRRFVTEPLARFMANLFLSESNPKKNVPHETSEQ